jgi:hypothetical protein
MCGRARLSSDVSEIKLAFRIPPERPMPNIARRWNVAPTDTLPVVRYGRQGPSAKIFSAASIASTARSVAVFIERRWDHRREERTCRSMDCQSRRSDPANLRRDVRALCRASGDKDVRTERSASANGPSGPASERGASLIRSPGDELDK